MPKITEEAREKSMNTMAGIRADRQIREQDLGWLFRPLAVCPFPAAPQGRREIIEDGKRVEEFRVRWIRRANSVRMEVLGHPDHGIPHGQDTLIVLYLAYEARRQGSRKIRVNFYRDFMRLFEMNPDDGRKYRLVVESLQRIRHASFSWEAEGEPGRERGLRFLYIDEYDLRCDPRDPEQGVSRDDQYIVLSERFWEEIRTHRIPSNLKAVIHLKAKPAHLNFYLWLSYRVWNVWSECPGEEVLVPYWGENGLQNQMSSVIERRNDFRIQVRKWMQSVRQVWPLCPVEIDGDALRILVAGEQELDVQARDTDAPRILPRREAEQPGPVTDTCPRCGRERVLREGQTAPRGHRLPDFWECSGGCGRTPAEALCATCGGPMEMRNKGRQDYSYFCGGCQRIVPGDHYWLLREGNNQEEGNQR